MTHSVAEDRRDIPGLMSTLTVDCVYVFDLDKLQDNLPNANQ